MLGESIRALRARPRALIAGVTMVVVAVMAMVVLPTLTDAASRKVLADLDALGSNAWIVVPQQLPTGPPALIPPGGLARASDLPGVISAVRVVNTTLQARLNRQDARPNGLSVLGVDSTPDADVIDTSLGVYRPVPGYRFAVIGSAAAAESGFSEYPMMVYVAGTPVIVTGVLRGDPLLPELDTAVVTDAATALALDPAATDQMVVREAGELTAARIRAGIDPLDTTSLAVSQPAALVAAREQSGATLSLLAVTATIGAFAVAALGITIMLASAVRQRTAELAIRRVHGARAGSIAALISTEALLIGIIGGLTALLLGNATVIAVVAGQGWPPTSSWRLQLAAFAAAVVMSLLASLPPALVATRIQPARAFAVE